MLSQASNLSSAMPVLWQLERAIRTKAIAREQNVLTEDIQEMSALEMKMELLVAHIKSCTEKGLSLEEITQNLEEEIWQVRLLLQAENLPKTVEDVEEALAEYQQQPEWAELIQSIEFACRVSFRLVNDRPGFIKEYFVSEGLVHDNEQIDSVIAKSIRQVQEMTFQQFRYGLTMNNQYALCNLLNSSFLLDVQLVCAILVLEKERILSKQELRLLCDAINDTAQTLGATWRMMKQSLHREQPESMSEPEYFIASTMEFDRELAEQGMEEYAELLVAEERV
ncbi:MAG: hypothetical protein MUF71_21155 [Candidatus Kapabacteria bacterium]|jgi:hypothetical protein|nr:hypothetical protein [Candidatus Kapabacteria bacterium]